MSKPLVLIIEDDAQLGTIYTIALQQIGCDVERDPLGNRYLDVLSRMSPALILLDLHMPFASGVEILKQLRANPQWAGIPVVVMSADIMQVKTIDLPPDRILIKPISVHRMQRIVTEIVDP